MPIVVAPTIDWSTPGTPSSAAISESPLANVVVTPSAANPVIAPALTVYCPTSSGGTFAYPMSS